MPLILAYDSVPAAGNHARHILQLDVYLPLSHPSHHRRHSLQPALPGVRDSFLPGKIQAQRDLQREVHALDDLLDLLLGAALRGQTAIFLPFRLRDQSHDRPPDGTSKSRGSQLDPAILRYQPHHNDIGNRSEESSAHKT